MDVPFGPGEHFWKNMIAASHINNVLALFFVVTPMVRSAFIDVGIHKRGLLRTRFNLSPCCLSLQNGDDNFDESKGMELACQFLKTIYQRQQAPPSPGTVLESEAKDAENRREFEGGK